MIHGSLNPFLGPICSRLNIDGYITFAGVLSRQTPFEDNCGTDGHPGVFSDLYYYSEWIQQGFYKIFSELTMIWFLEFIKSGKEFYGLSHEGFQLHSSKRFYYFVENVEKNYYDARRTCICENNDATFPVPSSDEENEHIAQLLPGSAIISGLQQ